MFSISRGMKAVEVRGYMLHLGSFIICLVSAKPSSFICDMVSSFNILSLLSPAGSQLANVHCVHLGKL